MYECIGESDWQRSNVYDLAIWKNGLAFKNIDFSDVGRPIIKIAELKNGVTAQTARTAVEYDPAVFIRQGDMLFSWSGNPDTSIDAFRWEGEDGWLNQHIFKVTPKVGISNEFLFFVLKWLRPRFAEIARNKQTTGLGHVTTRDLKRMVVGVPTLQEQDSIISIIGPLQAKIDLNRRMNETLEAMARAIFKDWFVDFGPTRAKMERRQPYLAPAIWALFPDRMNDEGRPKGWKNGRLDDLLLLQRGFDLRAASRRPGPYPVMAASGPNGTHEQFIVSAPGVTTGRSGVLGKVYYVQDNFWPLNTSLWVKQFKVASPLLAYFVLQRIDFDSFNAGSAVPTLNRNHVHNLPVVVPPKELVTAFDGAGLPLFQQKRLNDAETESLTATRDLLLPKLMSGGIRVKDAEKQLAAVA
jgi:type I restriction enzyme S subunit